MAFTFQGTKIANIKVVDKTVSPNTEKNLTSLHLGGTQVWGKRSFTLTLVNPSYMTVNFSYIDAKGDTITGIVGSTTTFSDIGFDQSITITATANTATATQVYYVNNKSSFSETYKPSQATSVSLTGSVATRLYTVTWKYLSAYPETWTTATESYEYGVAPSRANAATVTNSSNNSRRVFNNWSNLDPVTSNRTIQALYNYEYYITVTPAANTNVTANPTGWYQELFDEEGEPISYMSQFTVTDSAKYTFSSTRTTSMTSSSKEWYADGPKTITGPTPNIRQYTITWKWLSGDWPGTWTTYNEIYDYGSIPSRTAPENLVSGDDRKGFTAWDSLTAVTANRTITAQYAYEVYATFDQTYSTTATQAGWVPLNTVIDWTAKPGYSFNGEETEDTTSTIITQGGEYDCLPSYLWATITGVNCTADATTGMLPIGHIITWTATPETANVWYTFTNDEVIDPELMPVDTTEVIFGQLAYSKTAYTYVRAAITGEHILRKSCGAWQISDDSFHMILKDSVFNLLANASNTNRRYSFTNDDPQDPTFSKNITISEPGMYSNPASYIYDNIVLSIATNCTANYQSGWMLEGTSIRFTTKTKTSDTRYSFSFTYSTTYTKDVVVSSIRAGTTVSSGTVYIWRNVTVGAKYSSTVLASKSVWKTDGETVNSSSYYNDDPYNYNASTYYSGKTTNSITVSATATEVYTTYATTGVRTYTVQAVNAVSGQPLSSNVSVTINGTSGSSATLAYGTSVTMIVNANTNYYLTDGGDGEDFNYIPSKSNSITVNGTTQYRTYTFTFTVKDICNVDIYDPICYYTFTAPSGTGLVVSGTTTGAYDYGTSYSVTVTADSDYVITDYSGGTGLIDTRTDKAINGYSSDSERYPTKVTFSGTITGNTTISSVAKIIRCLTLLPGFHYTAVTYNTTGKVDYVRYNTTSIYPSYSKDTKYFYFTGSIDLDSTYYTRLSGINSDGTVAARTYNYKTYYYHTDDFVVSGVADGVTVKSSDISTQSILHFKSVDNNDPTPALAYNYMKITEQTYATDVIWGVQYQDIGHARVFNSSSSSVKLYGESITSYYSLGRGVTDIVTCQGLREGEDDDHSYDYIMAKGEHCVATIAIQDTYDGDTESYTALSNNLTALEIVSVAQDYSTLIKNPNSYACKLYFYYGDYQQNTVMTIPAGAQVWIGGADPTKSSIHLWTGTVHTAYLKDHVGAPYDDFNATGYLVSDALGVKSETQYIRFYYPHQS